MYIPSSVPTTLAAMLEFLQPMVADGFFDSVAYDDAESPSKIVCTQDGETILEMTVNGTSWTFTPYTASGTAAQGSHVYSGRSLETVFRCSGGAYFLSVSLSSQKYSFIIAKTSAGKTGFILANQSTNFNLAADIVYYPVCFGDDTTLGLYNGYHVRSNLVNADRTILTKLPVVGANGSTDYFTTAFVRNVVQFQETGVQLISGKRYACAYLAAITDDE